MDPEALRRDVDAVLDTSTLILLGDLPDETGLPTVPAITTVARPAASPPCAAWTP